LLGEKPGKSGMGDAPLGGRIAKRFADAMCWDGDAYERLCEYFEPVNLFSDWRDAEPWDARRASDLWVDLFMELLNALIMPTVLVCVGKRAAAAVGASNRPFYEWRTEQMYSRVIIPHPSGRNLFWNDPETPRRVRAVLTEALACSTAQGSR
jgi:hypothetical protein